MPLRFIDYGTEEYHQMVLLRREILRNPLGIDFSEDELAIEKEDILLGCFDEEKLEGCCLLRKAEDEAVRLRQMAVNYGLQGKGIGKALMLYAENIARDAGFKKIIMHARKTAVGFYEKMGYTVTGDEFVEVTIPHITMEKQLSA